MPLSEFVALMLLAGAAAFTPGPNTTLSTAIGANRGLRAALPFVCSVPVGWALMLLASAFGVATLVAEVPPLRWVILIAGVAYMLWLAARLAASGARLQSADGARDVGFVQGVLLQFVNVKAWLLLLAMVAGWLAGRPDRGVRLAVLLPTVMGHALCSNLLYAWIGAALRGWLAHGRRLVRFNRVMAATLALTALWMVWSTVR